MKIDLTEARVQVGKTAAQQPVYIYHFRIVLFGVAFPWDTYLLILVLPVYSLGALAVDESSPQNPALFHGDKLFPDSNHPIFLWEYHVILSVKKWPIQFYCGSGYPK